MDGQYFARETDGFQRTVATLAPVGERGWRVIEYAHAAGLSESGQCLLAQHFIEHNLVAPRRSNVVDVAMRNASRDYAQHFFQCECLSAELRMIGDPFSHLALFILYRVELASSC